MASRYSRRRTSGRATIDLGSILGAAGVGTPNLTPIDSGEAPILQPSSYDEAVAFQNQLGTTTPTLAQRYPRYENPGFFSNLISRGQARETVQGLNAQADFREADLLNQMQRDALNAQQASLQQEAQNAFTARIAAEQQAHNVLQSMGIVSTPESRAFVIQNINPVIQAQILAERTATSQAASSPEGQSAIAAGYLATQRRPAIDLRAAELGNQRAQTLNELLDYSVPSQRSGFDLQHEKNLTGVDRERMIRPFSLLTDLNNAKFESEFSGYRAQETPHFFKQELRRPVLENDLLMQRAAPQQNDFAARMQALQGLMGGSSNINAVPALPSTGGEFESIQLNDGSWAVRKRKVGN